MITCQVVQQSFYSKAHEKYKKEKVKARKEIKGVLWENLKIYEEFSLICFFGIEKWWFFY